MMDKMCAALGMIALKPLFDNIGIFDTFVITSILLIPVVYSVFVLVYKVKIK